MNSSTISTHHEQKSFRNNFRSLLVFFSIALIAMMGFRVSSLLLFGDWNELLNHRGEFGKFALLGFRYDMKFVATSALLIYWLPTVVASWWIRPEKFERFLLRAFATVLVIVLLMGCIDLGYQTFFGNPIDVLILGFIEDDTRAIFSTLLTDWRLILLMVAFIGLAIVTLRIFFFFAQKAVAKSQHLPRFLVTQFALLVILAILGRGSLDTFPLRTANASVGDSRFLNSLIMNSAQNLQHAIEDRGRSTITKGSKGILRDAKIAHPDELFRLAGYDGKDALIARSGPKKGPLPHVVFVQMEGWSTEIILGNSQRNQVLGEFERHMQEDHFYRHFFSNAYGTNPTIEAILLNSPITPLSHSAAQRTSFAMSNVWPFKKAGYRTAFISGGDSAWRNHEKFWPLQGFDSYTGRATIERKYHVDASNNPWGVYDEFVFAAVEDKIKEAEADGVPLFVYVLTTNNHSPIRLPKTYQPPPLDPSVYGFKPDDAKKYTDLTGFHYQTDQFGKFVSWVKSGDFRNKVIVAATGDHVLKGFTDYAPSERAYLRYSVPAYFYVPAGMDQLKTVPDMISGSHEDIFPTLFELALPNANYYDFGKPLMKKDPPHSYGWIESRDFIFPQGVASAVTQTISPWADTKQVLLSPNNQTADSWQSMVMTREKYRKLLKEWLLSRDYENRSK